MNIKVFNDNLSTKILNIQTVSSTLVTHDIAYTILPPKSIASTTPTLNDLTMNPMSTVSLDADSPRTFHFRSKQFLRRTYLPTPQSMVSIHTPPPTPVLNLASTNNVNNDV